MVSIAPWLATIKGAQCFNPEHEAQALRKAMKGLGTDEDTIIQILTLLNCSQRQQVLITYKSTIGRDLIDDLKSELKGNFERVIIALMTPSTMYDVHELRRAMKGPGTDESCLIEILASRTSEEIRNISQNYKLHYGSTLEEDIISDTSGRLQQVLVSLSTGGRDEGTYVDGSLAQQDAQCLFEAGENKWGTDEVQFISILCTRNVEHLLMVFDVYRSIANKDITDSIKSEMSGDLEDALLAVVKCLRNKPAYFAERLYKSMKGLGTDDSTLIRVMVSRSEVDMLDIRREFLAMYGKSLHSFIEGDCSGDYKKVLLRLCGGED
ncbi:annexin A4 [Indicator indicator]|uniref:annexin A4 n=1 Tax=Indicator indicator TaxID=1002788 RepID=UPI0023DFD424|nr:annexin A4 [Indicator indicator]